MSKVQRQTTISRLIGEHEVTSQPQLIELLAEHGIEATQATVSRDLDDIGAIKVRVPSGNTVYAIPEFAPDRVSDYGFFRGLVLLLIGIYLVVEGIGGYYRLKSLRRR